MNHRAAWVGVLFLGGALGLMAYLLTRGLPEDLRQASEAQIASFSEAQALLKQQGEALDKLIAEDKAYLEPQPEVAAAKAALNKHLAALTALTPKLEALRAGLKADKGGTASSLELLNGELKAPVAAAKGGITPEHEAVARLLSYKANHPSILEGARARVEAAKALATGMKQAEAAPSDAPPAAQPQDEAEKKKKLSYKALEAKLAEEEQRARVEVELLQARLQATGSEGGALYHEVRLAEAACPNASVKIRARYQQLQGLAEEIIKTGEAMEAKAKASPVDFAACGRLSEAIDHSAAALIKSQAALRADLKTLNRSEDKILIDMRREPSPAHKYKYIRGGDAQEGPWEPVTVAFYDQHSGHLGMALESKPECTLPEEATRVASPPGYAYVGNARYGTWERRNGMQVWIFNSHYRMHRDRLWGAGGYQPIQHQNWKSYQTSTSKGQPYFGAAKQYGTQGSYTQKRFANSQYITKARATKTSGGYSGSKYSNSSNKSSSSSSKSSNRSGSYRSSRYSSSSFGGSGK
ncbi:hypothetical protein KKF91_00340 [Myxococcota bacterium]|nr:hypothetical protein [Myxococcota bacterium]MBU1428983.1 hypothetical protein [Myxococcota bacterium]MBU1897641.1 hypothetical protein [Myxococcota bacterium]